MECAAIDKDPGTLFTMTNPLIKQPSGPAFLVLTAPFSPFLCPSALCTGEKRLERNRIEDEKKEKR